MGFWNMALWFFGSCFSELVLAGGGCHNQPACRPYLYGPNLPQIHPLSPQEGCHWKSHPLGCASCAHVEKNPLIHDHYMTIHDFSCTSYGISSFHFIISSRWPPRKLHMSQRWVSLPTAIMVLPRGRNSSHETWWMCYPIQGTSPASPP